MTAVCRYGRETSGHVRKKEMSDFIEAWQRKLYGSLRAYCGKETADRLMEGYEEITAETDPGEIIRWTAEKVRRIETECPSDMLHGIMTACSCPYPRGKLQELRDIYRATGDIDHVLESLQAQLEDSLRKGMLIEDEIVSRLVDLGWGVAGRREDGRILVTKIPRSGNLRNYMKEEDPEKRRQLYCHCPRVRKAVELGEVLPKNYCLCGAGYYLQIWETILETGVRVEVLESVCSGSDRCSFAIHIPEEAL
jgi:hypothetical protein